MSPTTPAAEMSAAGCGPRRSPAIVSSASDCLRPWVDFTRETLAKHFLFPRRSLVLEHRRADDRYHRPKAHPNPLPPPALRRRGHRWLCRWRFAPRAPPMCSAMREAICPIVRARIRLVGGRATPMELSIRVFDLHAHQRIQSEVRQRLIIAQGVGFYAQHGADHLAHRLADYRFLLGSGAAALILARQSLAPLLVSCVSTPEAKMRSSSGFSCKPRKDLPPFGPVHPDRRHLRDIRRQGTIPSASSLRRAKAPPCPAGREIRRHAHCAPRSLRRRARPS